MEIKLTVRAEIIAVLKLFAAVKDVRPYLKGINLEIGRRESRLVACDGSMLGCFRVESDQPLVDAPLGSIIIPNELLKVVKPSGLVEIVIGPLAESKGQERPVRVTYWSANGQSTTAQGVTINGTYPDFRRTIPSKVSGEPAQFDPRYLGTLAKAWGALHGNSTTPLVGIGFNGADTALIDLKDSDFVGVIMPWLPSKISAPKTPPDWWPDSLRVSTDSAEDLV